jgi:RNA polymerase sigma-70 factor (ECF subfamily)
VLRGINRLREASRFRPWLFGIARRVLMDRLRAQYAAPVVAEIDEEAIGSIELVDPASDDLDLLNEELERLSAIERDVLTLFYLQELSLAEIADVMSVPIGTVKSRLFRARNLLKREMDARRKHL